MTTRRLLRLTPLLIVLTGSATPALAEPLRLDRALDLPDRVSISFRHRLRYEHLWNQFRPVLDQNDEILLLRTLVHGRVRLMDWLTVGAELQDSRALDGEDSGFISSAIVNPAELLQAYGELSLYDTFGGDLQVRAGRITMDVGSRRLVARNRFRNTINGFTGIDATWKGENLTLRGFWALPVQRLPSTLDQDSLRDNDVEFDEERSKYNFWGLYAQGELPWWDTLGEAYLFGIHSDPNSDPPRRKRHLYTPGFRIYRVAARGRLDFEIETALQFGRSRSFRASTRTLDHFAYFQHAEVGYTFDAPWSPRVILQYDYASGDDDPDDGDNNRFDTLFGARRFDFGPTSIHGPFARANLNTPGLRLKLKPHENVSAFASFRAYWLAEDTDTWIGGSNRDPDGDSGTYIGSQLEFRLRWRLFPKNVHLEAGYAHIFDGEFMEDAPTSPSRGDADYVYTQITLYY